MLTPKYSDLKSPKIREIAFKIYITPCGVLLHAFVIYSIIIPAILAFKSRRDVRIIALDVFIRQDNPKGVTSFLSEKEKAEFTKGLHQAFSLLFYLPPDGRLFNQKFFMVSRRWSEVFSRSFMLWERMG